MYGDFHRVPRKVTAADDPVPDRTVPCLVYRGHDGIPILSSPDQEPEPPLIGERDASAGPVGEILAADVQDGRSRLIDEPADAMLGPGLRIVPDNPEVPVLSEVPVEVPFAAGEDLGKARR